MVKRFGFLSYSSNDKEFAEKLATSLNANGIEIFFDKWEIKVGDSIVNKIDTALGKMTDLIIVISENSINSNWVKKELSSALVKKLGNNSVKILPVLIEECNIPTIIADLKYADFVKGFENGFLDLMEALGLSKREEPLQKLTSASTIQKALAVVEKKPNLVKIVRFSPILRSNTMKTESNLIQFLATLVDGIGFMTGNLFVFCGNCKSSITVRREQTRPLVCSHCGEAINWVGLLTTLVRQCPVCKKSFPASQNFCPDHYPAVRLLENETEIPLWKS